ncbi:MAG TPA: hypothetical protein DDW31_04990 [candidate division Zixibacteria bacterium]|nr:hypothetical protein [candidate division Zixibacteria bacterium]
MHPEKGKKIKVADSGEEVPVREGLILDDDWAGHGQGDRGGRGRPPEDTDLDMADDSLLML